MAKSLSPGITGPSTDLVFTPTELAASIINHLPLTGKVLDPSRGAGAFYNQFPAHLDKDYCEITEGKDFFDYDQRVDWVVTNPPWSLMRQFLLHGFKIADNVSYLTTVNHAFTKARINDAKQHDFWLKEILLVDTPKAPWPQSGFQLGMITWSKGYNGHTNICELAI